MEFGKTVAVIDVGSNSIKLLVARRGLQGIETVCSHTIETRISTGISREAPVLQAEPMSAGVATITELFALAQTFSPAQIQIVATSAVRDAGNRAEFLDLVRLATELKVRVLSGAEEANYIGKGIACDPALAGVADFVQMDIGGGSLELIRFVAGEIEQAISTQLGAVRLTERFVEDKALAIHAELKARIQQHVTQEIEQSGFDFGAEPLPMVVTGGAFVISRAILAARRGVSLEDSEPSLSYQQLNELEQALSALPLSERSQVEHLPRARADIVPTALITILRVMEIAQCATVTHSLFNLRYGIAAELLESA